MKKIYFLLLFLILFLCPNVYAATYNVSSKVEAIPNFGGGTYGGYAKGIALPTYYNINTRYNGQLAMIDFFLDSDDWDWNYNKTYTITINMATEDWRNNFMGPQVFSAQTNGNTTGSNLYVTNTFRFISYKQIKFNFKLGSTLGPYIKFRLYSTNTNTTNITGISNWNLSSITISDVSSTPTPTPVNPTPTPSSASNQDIINNNNTNTETIIENNTQNTTDIINNNNSNTETIINNQNTNTNKEINSSCSLKTVELKPRFLGYVCDANGRLCLNSNYFASEYISINTGYEYTIHFKNIDGLQYGFYCWYNNDELISCEQYRQMDSYGLDTLITPPDNANLVSITYKKDSGATLEGYICSNPNSDIKDTLTDDNVDNGIGGGFFSDFDDQDYGLSSIITIPLSTIQSLSSSSCISLDIPIPFTNDNITLPCMSELYDAHAHDIFVLWKIVSFGIISYYICIDIFKMVKGFKDPESDKVEVLDL